MRTFVSCKAPGSDGIDPALIQKGFDCLSRHLVEIYRACLCSGNPEFFPNLGKTIPGM